MSASLREMPVSNVTRMHMPRVKSSLAQRDADARVNIRPAHSSPSSCVVDTVSESKRGRRCFEPPVASHLRQTGYSPAEQGTPQINQACHPYAARCKYLQQLHSSYG
ncbi:hypothetical protein L914_06586 [Phytophthora nicotianae]|uniref:Uncharacterized protein n=1 Tax=Phytophthora nicotianae TaxID=4792 RepID=W2NM22_PHYNI|nr:hypothetical protein L914_06586 [Phytophthora nicotianae]